MMSEHFNLDFFCILPPFVQHSQKPVRKMKLAYHHFNFRPLPQIENLKLHFYFFDNNRRNEQVKV